MNLDIYTNEDDYMSGTGAIIHTRLPGSRTTSVSAEKFTAGNTYYYDIYSDDHTYTNWVFYGKPSLWYDSSTYTSFKYAGTDALVGGTTLQTNARISLLDKTKSGSSWKAIGALDVTTGASCWASLNEAQQSFRAVVRKDHTGTFFSQRGGSTLETNFKFDGIPGYPNYSFNIVDSTFTSFIENTNVNPGTSQHVPVTLDTLVCLWNEIMYVMAKEK